MKMDKKQRSQPKRCLQRVPHTRKQRAVKKILPPTQQSIHKCGEEAITSTTSLNDVSEYAEAINSHCQDIDLKHYLRVQRHTANEVHSTITSNMRRMLLKWLMSVVQCFRMKEDTLHFCVQLIDFMLIFDPATIHKANLQLLGITALFMASKYNEIYTHAAEKYVFLCNGLYTMEQMLAMESTILLKTQFNLQFPIVTEYTEQFTLGLDAIAQRAAKDCIRTLTHVATLDFELSNFCRKTHLSLLIMALTCQILNIDHTQRTQMQDTQFQYYFQRLANGYAAHDYQLCQSI